MKATTSFLALSNTKEDAFHSNKTAGIALIT